MYDSYSEVECLDTSKSMTRDEYTEFVIQRSLFLDKLKAEVARYDKIISQIDSLDSELVQAYRYKRHKVLALSKIPIIRMNWKNSVRGCTTAARSGAERRLRRRMRQSWKRSAARWTWNLEEAQITISKRPSS